MTPALSRENFDSLERRVAKLENVLCDMAALRGEGHGLTRDELKKFLKEEGIADFAGAED